MKSKFPLLIAFLLDEEVELPEEDKRFWNIVIGICCLVIAVGVELVCWVTTWGAI